MTTRTITVTVDESTFANALEAIQANAELRLRAAAMAAAELEAEGGKDKRSGAVAITRTLADAGRLETFARHLLGAWDAAEPAPDPLATRAGVTFPELEPAGAIPTPEELHADVAALAAAAAGGDLPPSALAEDLETEPDPSRVAALLAGTLTE